MRIEGEPEDWLSWLTGSSSRRRKEATLILGGLTPEDNVRLAPLIEALSSEIDDLVFWSATGLGCSGSRAINAVSELVRVASFHEQFGNRQAAVSALSEIAPDSAIAKAAVLRSLGDSSPIVRRQALQALIQFTELSADDLCRIEVMEHDPDEAVASWSEIALRNIRSNTQHKQPKN